MPESPNLDMSSGPSSTDIRKLAAIMFTDIKDFSKRMQQDEALMLQLLEMHNRMMYHAVQKYKGTVVKTIGDAFLASFESVVDAVSCAVEVQQNFLDYNSDKPADKRILVRIGVHLGDVIVKNNDIFGDGVNIASRVQAMAEPGGVNITDSVYQQVKNKLNIQAINRGTPPLKGIQQAVKLYQVIILPSRKASRKFSQKLYVVGTVLRRRRSKQILAGTVGVVLLALVFRPMLVSPPPINSIAVLPFENMGPPEEEYRSDALSEEIIARLGQLPNVVVVSRSSTFRYKNTDRDEMSIARDLGVQFLLKGAVQSFADQMAVTVNLIDGVSGNRIISNAYIVTRDELAQLQYEIPRQIASRFNLQFTGRVDTTTPEVYDLYARGMFARGKLQRESNLIAIKYFSDALERDPKYVPAIVGLAKAYWFNYDYGWDRRKVILGQVEHLCQRALLLDSTDADATAILDKVKISMGQRDVGVQLLEKALHFNPRNYTALDALGYEYTFHRSDPAKGLFYRQRAFEIEPTNPMLANNIAVAYAMMKNYAEAIRAFRRAAFLDPTNDYPLANLAVSFERNGEFDSALVYYERATQKNSGREDLYLWWGELLLALHRPAAAESVFLTGIRLAHERPRLFYDLGVAYNMQGKTELAQKVWYEGLQMIEDKLKDDDMSSKYFATASLLCARLKKNTDAVQYLHKSITADSTDSEAFFNAARVYAVLDRKKEMVELLRKARSMNPEYDAHYFNIAIDFEKYRNDSELLTLLR